MITESVDEYLEAIHKLEAEKTPVAISILAERLGISATTRSSYPSVD